MQRIISLSSNWSDDNKFALNTDQSQRQQAKRQRLSDSARQHQSVALSPNIPMNNVRPTNGQIRNGSELNTTSNNRILPLSLVEYQHIPFSKRTSKEMEDEQQQQLLLARQIHGKPTKYTTGALDSSPRLESDQHLVFEDNFIVSRPSLSSQSSLANQRTGTHHSEVGSFGQYTQQAQQQLSGHNQMNEQGQLQEHQQSELHTLYHPPNYLQQQMRQAEPRFEDQISISNCFEPHQQNLDHQLTTQHFDQQEPSSCFGTSPQVTDQQQQQQQFLADHSSYYQSQATYLHVEPQYDWQCHSQQTQLHLPPPLPLPHELASHQHQHQNHQHQHQQHNPPPSHHQQQHHRQVSSNIDGISQQQHMIDEQQQQQPTDGLPSESYPKRRHNFVSLDPPYHVAEPTYSLVYQPDCNNTARLNVNLTNNNPGQQLFLIDETSQHLNYSVGHLSQILN